MILKKLYSFLTTALIFLMLAGCGKLVKLKFEKGQQFSEENSWLTLGRNQQHQHYATDNIAPPLDIVWKRNVKSVVTDHPLALGDYILASTKNGSMYLVHYESGERIASGKLGHALSNAPSIHNRDLFTGISHGEKTLMGFNLEKSDKLWSEKYPHVNTSPLINDDKIYFGTNRERFYCADLESGEKLWEYKTEASIKSSPAYQSDFVVFGDNHGWLYALDAESGEEKWKIALDGSIFSHPVLDELVVYIGTVTGKMYAISLYTGEISWEKEFDGSIYSSPALYKNVLYFGTNAHDVIALHKESGDLIWTFKTKGIVNTVPLPSPDYLYVTSWDRHLYVLNRFSGEMLFKQKLRRPAKSSPIIYRDYLILHTANDKLIALANEKFLQDRKESRESK